MSKPVYITTPLYYVNAAPHIGHSYTQVAADAAARFYRLRGDDVFFLTGTDEHGDKVAQAAAAQGLSPKAFADLNSAKFQSVWELLGIAGSLSRFIRTTDPDHEAAVQRALEALKPLLRLGPYTFWYCLPDETSFSLTEVNAANPICPNCGRPVTKTEEKDYFLTLEEHREWLRAYIESHDQFILPIERRNEVLALLRDPSNPLPDLCLTRPKDRVSWGIEVPFSRQHVTYVWFDALLNYISALGWPSDPRFHRYWEEAGAVHLIGKDILRHHALYWPIILHALGLPPPRTIFAHGWWKIGEQKMSKSLGNIVDPVAVVTHLLAGQPHAADIYRYFLLREVPFGQDGAFSEDALLKRLSSDLANDLGNLVNRTMSMLERYVGGRVTPTPIGQLETATGERALGDHALSLAGALDRAMARFEFSTALTAIMDVVSRANQYIEASAPWKQAKQGHAKRVERILATLAEVIRITAITLDPFMPSVAEAIWQQLGCGPTPRRLQDATVWPGLTSGQSIGPHPVLFPRIDTPKPS